MSRTPGSAGNRKIWTFSTWIKRTKTSSALAQLIFMAGVANDRTFIDFTTDDTLEVGTRVSGTFTYWRKTTQVFRDYSAWYHIVVSLNTTDGTAGDRVKVYVNGSQVSNFGTTNNPAEDFEGDIGDTDAHYIASYINSSNYVSKLWNWKLSVTSDDAKSEGWLGAGIGKYMREKEEELFLTSS